MVAFGKVPAVRRMAGNALLAMTTCHERKAHWIADLDTLVANFGADCFDNTGTFVAEDCGIVTNTLKESLLEDDILKRS
jgi:hypothetical protein